MGVWRLAFGVWRLAFGVLVLVLVLVLENGVAQQKGFWHRSVAY